MVVVRPTEKRLKKKEKRGQDPARQDYARILKESGIYEHETEITSRNNSIFEATNEPDVEAHEVAAGMSLSSKTFRILSLIDCYSPWTSCTLRSHSEAICLR